MGCMSALVWLKLALICSASACQIGCENRTTAPGWQRQSLDLFDFLQNEADLLWGQDRWCKVPVSIIDVSYFEFISKEVRLHLLILWRTFLDVSTHLGDISMALAQQWAPRQHNQTQSPLSTRQQAAIVPWSPTSPPPPTASSTTLPQIKTNISPKKPGQSPNGSESGWRHILSEFWALIGWLDHGKFLAGWIFLAAAALTWGFLLFTFILGTL